MAGRPRGRLRRPRAARRLQQVHSKGGSSPAACDAVASAPRQRLSGTLASLPLPLFPLSLLQCASPASTFVASKGRMGTRAARVQGPQARPFGRSWADRAVTPLSPAAAPGAANAPLLCSFSVCLEVQLSTLMQVEAKAARVSWRKYDAWLVRPPLTLTPPPPLGISPAGRHHKRINPGY